MRAPSPALALPSLFLFAACSSSPSGAERSSAGNAALLGSPTGQDAADHACNVVLRDAHLNLGRDGYESSCDASGKCWIVWSGDVDISTEASEENDAPFITYQGGSDPTWRTVAATRSTTSSAPAGFVRYSFELDANTAPYPGPFDDVQLVPYLQTQTGSRLFDHNRNANPYANYVLNAADSYAIAQDSACAAPPATANATIDFGMPWTTTQHGPIVQGGNVTVDYTLARLPQCFSSAAEGLPAWATTAYALFTPGNQTAQTSFIPTSPGGSTTDLFLSLTVPADATGLQLWFMTSGETCGANHYDSNYGANYRFPVASQAPSAVAWAGNWGGSFDRSCQHVDGLAQPIDVTSFTITQACMFVDAEVYVPGLTDGAAEHPELVLAQALATTDADPQVTTWLTYVGRFGNNYRYRWTIDNNTLDTTTWGAISFTFRFSTDGATWTTIGQADGTARTLVHQGN